MKILECIHSLQPGGAERFLVDLSNELSNENDVTILTLKNRDSKNENFYKGDIHPNIKVISLGFEDGFHLSYLFKVYYAIKSLSPDVVHIHCILQYMIFAILFYRRCKYVQTLHNDARYGIPRSIVKLAIWIIRHHYLTMITISDSNRQSFRNYTGLMNDVLIYNGRKQPQLTSLYNKTKEYVEKIKENEHDIVLLCIAKCALQKNLNLLIESVNCLTGKGVNLKLLIIGDNYQNTELGRKWISLAQNNRSIHFLGARKNVADYFYLCDAFCLSSIFEGMPITLIEALACKCIPISTPVSGVIDLIEDGKTGFISNDFTEESYIKTLVRFVENYKKIDKELLYELYKENYSIEKCSISYLKVFCDK